MTTPLPIAVGWIPNVCGKLIYERVQESFDGFDISIVDTFGLYSSGNYKIIGSVPVPQGYRAESFIFTSVIDNNDLTPTASTTQYTRLVCFGHKNRDDILEGSIYSIAVTDQDDDNQSSSGFTSEAHKDLLIKIKAVEEKFTEDSNVIGNSFYEDMKYTRKSNPVLCFDDVKSYLDDPVENITGSIYNAFKGTFTIHPDGIVHIDTVSQFDFPHSQEKEELEKRIKSQFSAEFYLRLKSLFHSHHHHDSENDDVLSAVSIKEPSTGASNDQQQQLEDAYFKIINNLKRSIVDFRARPIHNKEAHSHLEGLCAYGKTCLFILEQKGVISENKLAAEVSFFSNTQESCKSTIASHEYFFTKMPTKNSAKYYYLKYFMLFFAIIMSILIPLQQILGFTSYLPSIKNTVVYIFGANFYQCLEKIINIDDLFPVLFIAIIIILTISDILTKMKFNERGVLGSLGLGVWHTLSDVYDFILNCKTQSFTLTKKPFRFHIKLKANKIMRLHYDDNLIKRLKIKLHESLVLFSIWFFSLMLFLYIVFFN